MIHSYIVHISVRWSYNLFVHFMQSFYSYHQRSIGRCSMNYFKWFNPFNVSCLTSPVIALILHKNVLINTDITYISATPITVLEKTRKWQNLLRHADMPIYVIDRLPVHDNEQKISGHSRYSWHWYFSTQCENVKCALVIYSLTSKKSCARG